MDKLEKTMKPKNGGQIGHEKNVQIGQKQKLLQKILNDRLHWVYSGNDYS